jgi:twinkle protein
MADITSTFLRHEPCPECGSSDALSVYDDGHSYCFSCHFYAPGECDSGLLRPTTLPLRRMHIRGTAVPLRNRGLSELTVSKYKIHRDGDHLLFHYHTADGRLCGIKSKTKDKDFFYEGETDGSFFGQHLFPNNGKRIYIYEGELDAASGAEVLPTWPHVSLPNGAAAAKKSIQKNLEFLQGYSEIVLFFDNDEPGRKAVEEAASVLPPGRVFIARMDKFKDASDALQAKEVDTLKRAMWNASPYRPDGIVDARNLLELVTTPNPPHDYEYRQAGLNNLLHGIRHGELVTITAGSGTGKSSFCRDLASSLLQDGERVGYLALEESNRRTLLGLMSTACGESLHIGEHDKKHLTEIYESTVNNWNLFLFDGFGSFDPDIIYNRIEYLAAGLDTRVVFLDHLSILMSGLDGDERRMIDTTMTRLRSLVERTGISLFLVSHLRRGNTDQGHEEGARVSLGQLRGSAAIAQLSDAVIALERDQQSGSEHSDTVVRVLKNRYSGETGVACKLRYDLSTCKFTETNETKPFDATTDF